VVSKSCDKGKAYKTDSRNSSTRSDSKIKEKG
jgi:hypothetical protein